MPLRSLLAGLVLAIATAAAADAWPDGKELTGRMLDLGGLDRASVQELGRSPGGQKLRLLEIAPATGDGQGPAILVVANLEGDRPLASLAAVELAAELLATGDGPAAAVRWYVVPIANPDGFDHQFALPRTGRGRNDTPVDEDTDGLEGEDGPDDLDGDRLITWMLVEDPAGEWRLDADGLPVKADPARGYPGRYRREIEGRDDDGDGRFNEDPPGGVDVSRNFPHGFEPWGTAGRWPGDQPEARALLEFAAAHPDIAMVLVLGATNNLWEVPAPASAADPHQMVAPGWRLARSLGLSPGQEYELSTVLAAAEAAGGRVGLTPTALKARLHLGQVEKPLAEDLGWWGALSDRYHAFRRENGLAGPRVEPEPPADGSLAAWAYFHHGVPTVALDLWSLPMPADTVAVDPDGLDVALTDTTEIDDHPVPDPVHAQLKRRTATAGHPGWHDWTPVTLPDGTAALVGGPIPGADHTPAAYAANTRARAMLPFCLELAGWLPQLAVDPLRIEPTPSSSATVVAVTVTVRNLGRLPYPTAMGAVNQRPRPLVTTLQGGEPLHDDARRTIAELPAGGAATVRWLVRTDDPDELSVTVASPSLGEITRKGDAR